MELIRSFCGRLRALAVTLDSETARLQRALDGEDSGERGRGRARGEGRLSASGGPEGRGARDGWSPGVCSSQTCYRNKVKRFPVNAAV